MPLGHEERATRSKDDMRATLSEFDEEGDTFAVRVNMLMDTAAHNPSQMRQVQTVLAHVTYDEHVRAESLAAELGRRDQAALQGGDSASEAALHDVQHRCNGAMQEVAMQKKLHDADAVEIAQLNAQLGALRTNRGDAANGDELVAKVTRLETELAAARTNNDNLIAVAHGYTLEACARPGRKAERTGSRA